MSAPLPRQAMMWLHYISHYFWLHIWNLHYPFDMWAYFHREIWKFCPCVINEKYLPICLLLPGNQNCVNVKKSFAIVIQKRVMLSIALFKMSMNYLLNLEQVFKTCTAVNLGNDNWVWLAEHSIISFHKHTAFCVFLKLMEEWIIHLVGII